MANGDDIYSALVGGAPTDPQRQAMLAAQLRNQAQQGRFLQASGDRVIAPMGEQMNEEAMRSATGVAGEREREANLRMMMEYRQAQETNMAQKIASNILMEREKGQTSRDVANVKGQWSYETAGERAAGKVKPIPEATRKQLDDARASMAGAQEALDNFKPGYGGSGRNLKNWQAANLPSTATQAEKDANFWWASYGRQFTLPELKATIGLRHNQYMQGVFEAYHLNPNMDDTQIPKTLGSIHQQVYDRISRAVTALQRQGYDIGGYEQFLGNPDAVDKIAKHSAQQGVPAVAPTPATQPAARWLHKQSVSGPAYMMAPGATQPQPGAVPQPGAQPMAPTPFLRPTPPMAPGGGNLFQGLGGIPGG